MNYGNSWRRMGEKLDLDQFLECDYSSISTLVIELNLGKKTLFVHSQTNCHQ
jgi:hypothetical protein